MASSKVESASWKHEKLFGNMRAVQPSFLVITHCFYYYYYYYYFHLYISPIKKCRWKNFMEHPFAIQWHCRNTPPAPSYVMRLCDIKDNQCPLIYVCDANRNGNNKMVLIVLLKKDAKTNDISPGQFIAYLPLNRPGTALQVDITT